MVYFLRHAAQVAIVGGAGQGFGQVDVAHGARIGLEQQGIEILPQRLALTMGPLARDFAHFRVDSLYAPGSLGHLGSESCGRSFAHPSIAGQLAVIRLTPLKC